jgi:hypothetical protein
VTAGQRCSTWNRSAVPPFTAPSLLDHVLKNSEKLIEIPCRLPENWQKTACGPEPQLVPKAIGCNELAKLPGTKWLKPHLKRLGAIKLKNADLFALAESRVVPEDRYPGTNDPLTDMYIAVTHRLPNLTCAREHRVER